MYELSNQQKESIYFNSGNANDICKYLNTTNKLQISEFINPLFDEIIQDLQSYNIHINVIDIYNKSFFVADKNPISNFKIYLTYKGIKVYLTLDKLSVVNLLK